MDEEGKRLFDTLTKGLSLSSSSSMSRSKSSGNIVGTATQKKMEDDCMNSGIGGRNRSRSRSVGRRVLGSSIHSTSSKNHLRYRLRRLDQWGVVVRLRKS